MPGNASSHDLIVVGAGINGAAIAREASLRGLRSLLVDQGDVAAGVTSASTRLIHGGLRYLEHAELSLVRQSLAERERLLRLAPHLVTPLRLYLPVYAQGRRRLWQIRLGLFLYERLFRSQLLPRHAMLSAEETRRRLPGLRAVGLGGAATYFDAQVAFPERLVVENVRDAVRHGAELATYTRVTEIATQEGGVRGVRWLDGAGRRGAARASVVVNAAGPWVDRVLGPLAARPLVGGSKGSHLILAPFPGAPDAAVHAEASDGRPFFVIPWNGLFLIGTTEQGYGGDPGAATVTEAERAYLVREAQTLFPSAGGLSAAVRYTQSGVRPLPSTRRSDLGAVTRRHLIHRHRGVRGLYSVVGGKLTTHRDLAEDVLHVLADALADAKGPSPTASRPATVEHLRRRVGRSRRERSRATRASGRAGAVPADLGRRAGPSDRSRMGDVADRHPAAALHGRTGPRFRSRRGRGRRRVASAGRPVGPAAGGTGAGRIPCLRAPQTGFRRRQPVRRLPCGRARGRYKLRISASPNSEHLTSVASSMRRAKS
jgi:glycerol-3-phosphate dehydrogenase